MKKTDLAFIYHTGDEKSVVGIAEIVSAPYADPKLKDPRSAVVDLKPKEQLKIPVPLSAIKARKELADFVLVRMGRLSVMPVSALQWKTIIAMSR
jgi:predicted RNA-binding protein with PUA-like domain